VPIAAVADAIALYATNPVEYQRATKNCGAAAERYSLDEIAHKYGAVYTAVLGTRRLIPTNTTIGFAAFPSGRHRATIDCSYNMQWVSANSGLSRDLQILINRIIKHLINKPKLTGIILYVSRRWLGFK
jgi:hypothetical protein